jgi:hypothetical protein
MKVHLRDTNRPPMIWCGRTNYKYPEMPVTSDISQVTCRTCLMAYNRSKEIKERRADANNFQEIGAKGTRL